MHGVKRLLGAVLLLHLTGCVEAVGGYQMSARTPSHGVSAGIRLMIPIETKLAAVSGVHIDGTTEGFAQYQTLGLRYLAPVGDKFGLTVHGYGGVGGASRNAFQWSSPMLNAGAEVGFAWSTQTRSVLSTSFTTGTGVALRGQYLFTNGQTRMDGPYAALLVFHDF